MKKIFCLMLVLLSSATSVFAATQLATGEVSDAAAAVYGGTDQTSAEASVNPIIKFSTGVSGLANFDNTGYSVHTKHLNGSKVFGTANDSTNIFWKASPSKVLMTADECGTTVGTANYADGTGWTSY